MTKSLFKTFQNEIDDVSEILDDMTVADEGGSSESTPVPVGDAFLRLVGYVEIGNQAIPPNKNKPEGEVRVDSFVLEFEVYPIGDEDPEDYKAHGKWKRLSTYPQRRSRNPKANSFKWFQSMNYKGNVTHFAQMLGQLFIAPITEGKKAGSRNIEMAKIAPAIDRVTKKPYDAPAMDEDSVRLFLWGAPTKVQWESLAWVGSDGTPKLGRYQEQILNAQNYEGSPIQTLLEEGGMLEDTLEELHETEKARKARKQAQEASEGGGEGYTPTPPKKTPQRPSKGLPEVKARKVSVPDDEEDDIPDFPIPKKRAKVALPDDDE